MKSQLAIRRELRRVAKALKSNDATHGVDYNGLYGAQQALSWALGEAVMAPAKAFSPVKGR